MKRVSVLVLIINILFSVSAHSQNIPHDDKHDNGENNISRILTSINQIRTMMENTPISPDVILRTVGHLFTYSQGTRIKSVLEALRINVYKELDAAEASIHANDSEGVHTHFNNALGFYKAYHEIAKELYAVLVDDSRQRQEELEQQLRKYESPI